MDAVNVLSLSQQQMDSVRDGSEHHLQGVHHFAMAPESHHHHQQQQQQHHHHHIPGQYVVRDGQHFVLREDLQGVAAQYGVREGELQGSQQALVALAGGMGVVAPGSHDDHHQAVNKLELRWTEQGFCDARGDGSGGGQHQIVKEVRWEQPLYSGRAESVSVMEGAHHVLDGSHHVVMQAEGGRWEDPSLCDANDDDELRNDSDQPDSKRTREVRWTEQALCDAVAAVKSGSLTAYKASKDFGIPRSTLRNWLNGRNRSRKRGPKVDEALSFCRQEMQGDQHPGTLMMGNEVTLNSGEEGHGSDSKEDSLLRKRRRVWTKHTLFEALNAVRNGGMAVSKAAQVYGIPNSTLDYWMKEQEKKSSSSGTEVTVYGQPFHGSREDAYAMAVAEMNDDEDDEEDDEDDDEEDGGDDQIPDGGEKKERLKKKAREGKKKVGCWTEKALMEAMEAIKNNTLTICKASRAYGIPRTTLRNWITGRTRSRKRGPHTSLAFEQGDSSLGEEGVRMTGEDFPYNDASEELTPGRDDACVEQQLESAEISMSGGKKRGKGGKWTEQALLDAVEAVKSGSCTIGSAGQQFGIPRSTLKYTLNGAQKRSPSGGGGGGGEGKQEEDEGQFESGEMKESDEKSRKSNGWTEQALHNALAAIKNGISIRKAGQCYGIPRTTLRNWLNGRTHSRKRGPHGGMTRGEQESAIVEWFFSIQQVSQSLMTLNSLRRRVAPLSVNKGSPFKDGIPVKKWWVWFNRRHPDVAARVGEGLQEAQNRSLIDEMSVVHMVTGEHLQILRRKVEGEMDKMELSLVQRAEEFESSSQEEAEEEEEEEGEQSAMAGGGGALEQQQQQQHHQHHPSGGSGGGGSGIIAAPTANNPGASCCDRSDANIAHHHHSQHQHHHSHHHHHTLV
ncbi:uncharacterized protein LOC112344834 [Selaginella moellendorffii]|uniref:uncharacterized protein LOC112344834 n=1 Tax=Selaginella moellendorffii TaxID=88036 RepID=UPI000D1C72BC|nr:uncharacterized protein LOC112344834 [Selaginella moellendorffii]|eukprot:XP_024526055.1 uncharacterized protein LOC112344834 [Selaginella moellendorffii]